MLAILAAVSVGACGGGGGTPVDAIPVDVPADAMPREVIMENVPLVVTEIVEAKLIGGPGDYARIRLMNPTPTLDWNLHGHADGSTQIVEEELQVMTVDYLFLPPAQAEWYLLLRNRGQTDTTVQLVIELYGNITWSGWI
jgi:hypothetical protein